MKLLEIMMYTESVLSREANKVEANKVKPGEKTQ